MSLVCTEIPTTFSCYGSKGPETSCPWLKLHKYNPVPLPRYNGMVHARAAIILWSKVQRAVVSGRTVLYTTVCSTIRRYLCCYARLWSMYERERALWRWGLVVGRSVVGNAVRQDAKPGHLFRDTRVRLIVVYHI